ncbi:MAG: histidine phosphatase family protein [Wenzhouxiangella sp.]|nr:histidine phosphatase family protein [Wenzhouxiangella sp.]
MNIWLLRHASAEHRASSGRDEDRRLTAAGRSTCHDLQAWIRNCDQPKPTRLLVSPAQRTLETARHTFGHLNFPDGEIEPRLWNASVGDLVALIDEVGETSKSVMLIAHNPGLEGLVRWLGGKLPAVGMKAGTLVIMETSAPLQPGQGRALRIFQASDST